MFRDEPDDLSLDADNEDDTYFFCQHGGDPARCIKCNPETGDPDEWNESHYLNDTPVISTVQRIKDLEEIIERMLVDIKMYGRLSTPTKEHAKNILIMPEKKGE